jgi:drug/metabolite transporter (DMT)-like permease
MLNMIFCVLVYTFVLAFSQILLKLGLNQIGALHPKEIKDLFPLLLAIALNYYVVAGTVLMAGSFFLWLTMLSWFKLSVIFPTTALVYVFAACLSYFMLGEKMFLQNYFGVLLIAGGIVLLLFKQI